MNYNILALFLFRVDVSLTPYFCLTPLKGGPSGVGFRRALEEIEAAENIQVEDAISLSTGTERERQQTSVQAFINSYASGTGFNDTTQTGITGPTTRLPQVASAPVESGGAGGVVFGGGAGAGAPGIAGGTLPILSK